MSRSRGCLGTSIPKRVRNALCSCLIYFLVLGSINIDEIYEVPHIVRQGETLSSSNFVRGSGGKGILCQLLGLAEDLSQKSTGGNCAVAIAQAGGQVDFAGFIGPDGQFLKDQLHSCTLTLSCSLAREVKSILPVGVGVTHLKQVDVNTLSALRVRKSH